MIQFTEGDTVYYISHAIFVREATVLRCQAGFTTIKFRDTGGGTRVRNSKLFTSKEEAKKVVDQLKEDRKKTL